MKQVTNINQNGFTLIQMLLYSALSGIVLTVFTSYLFVVVQNRVKYEVTSAVSIAGEQILELVVDEIQAAGGVNTPLPGASGTILSLQDLVPADNPTVLTYSANALSLTEGLSSAIPLHSGFMEVSSFTVRNLSRDGSEQSIQIEFTVRHISNGSRNEYDYEQTFITTASTR